MTQTHLHQSNTVWNSELGEFIDDRHAHLAQIIRDYKPTYELVYIPKKERDATDTKPWAILERHPKTGNNIVRYLSEIEMNDPAGVLEWLFNADLDRNRPQDVFQRIQNREAAEQLMKLKAEEEEMHDRLEKVATIASGGRDKKHWFRHNGITYRN
jgi:hypothetical protein